MGILALMEERAVKQSAGTVANPTWIPDSWLRESDAGVVVNERTALQCSQVYACCRIRGEDSGSVPLKTYEKLEPRGRRRATDHPIYRLLHDQPNPMMSAMTFREAISFHVDLCGRAFAWIEYDRRLIPRALRLLRPDRTRVERKDGRLWYFVRAEDSAVEEAFEDWEILHFPGLGFDGVNSFSPIAMQMQAIGLALATQEHGARFFGNGARPGGYLKHPRTLSEAAYKRLKEAHAAEHQGVAKSSRPKILEEGMDWISVSIPNDEAQFLETRKFQLAEIARFYRMPLHKLQDLEHATFSNIEHQALEYVTDSLRPHVVRMEQEYNRKLFSPAQTGRFYVEHDLDGLQRGDYKSRMEGHAIRRGNGLASYNDLAEVENWRFDNSEAGDEMYVPLNWVPARLAAGLATKKVPPAPALRDEPMRARELKARIAPACERLFADAAVRSLRREGKALDRAIGRIAGEGLAGFETWSGPFYREHRVLLRGMLMSPVAAVAELLGGSDACEDAGPRRCMHGLCEVLADSWVRESLDGMVGVIGSWATTPGPGGPPATLEAHLRALISDWGTKRPTRFAAAAIERAMRELDVVLKESPGRKVA